MPRNKKTNTAQTGSAGSGTGRAAPKTRTRGAKKPAASQEDTHAKRDPEHLVDAVDADSDDWEDDFGDEYGNYDEEYSDKEGGATDDEADDTADAPEHLVADAADEPEEDELDAVGGPVGADGGDPPTADNMPEEAKYIAEVIIRRRENYITPSVLTKFEMAMLTTKRTEMIARGGPCMVPIDGLDCASKMARREIMMRKCPLIVRRVIGRDLTGGIEKIYVEDHNPNEMEFTTTYNDV